MFDRTDKLVEATMLALQGKLELKESRASRKAKTKKAESIDVNVDETTSVSVNDNTTIVDTADATIMIEEPKESIEEPVADVPVDTVEVPVDDTVMPEEVVDEPVDTELPTETEPTIDEIVNDDVPVDTDEEKDESKKLKEDVDIEISDDGKEVEVTTDNHEEVEVTDVTPTEDEKPEDEETDDLKVDGNENIEGEEIIDDKLVDECKKITEDVTNYNGAYGYFADVTREVAQNIDNLNNDTKYQDAIADDKKLELVIDSIMDDDELWNTLQETIVYYIDELIAGNLNESKKVEKINKNNFEINNAIANPQLKANREKIRKAGYETDKKSVTNPRNGRTFQTKYAPNKDKIDWKNRLEKDKTDFEAIVGPESDKIPNSRKINQKSTTATYSKADADAYGVKYGPKDECDRVVEDTDVALEPRYDSRNSFYGKARVVTKDNGDEELYSYGTLVAGIKDGKPYSKGKFSQTTSRHQREFFKQRDIDPATVEVVEEGKECKNCKECDNKLEAFRAKSRELRHAKIQEMLSKKTESKEEVKDVNDLGIVEGVPDKEEAVPNTEEAKIKVESKFSSKSFNEALTTYLKSQYKIVESVEVTKLAQNKTGDIKIEAVVHNITKRDRNICLEMHKVQEGRTFNKYTLKNAVGLIKESKDTDTKLNMVTFTNKQNVLECRYFIKK